MRQVGRREGSTREPLPLCVQTFACSRAAHRLGSAATGGGCCMEDATASRSPREYAARILPAARRRRPPGNKNRVCSMRGRRGLGPESACRKRHAPVPSEREVPDTAMGRSQSDKSNVPSLAQASGIATTSAWPVGSRVFSTRFHPSPTMVPAWPMTAPNGPPSPRPTASGARSSAVRMNTVFDMRQPMRAPGTPSTGRSPDSRCSASCQPASPG